VPATVHIFHPRPGAAAALATRLGRRCEVIDTVERLFALLPELEVLIAPELPHGPWDMAERLSLVHALGAGIDGLQHLPARIPIACARGLFAPEVAGHTWALILALARDLPCALDQQRRREWHTYRPPGLAGRTLGILGLGEIGRRLADIGAAFGLRVIGTRRRPCEMPNVARVLPPESTDELLAAADIVAVTLPRTPATLGSLDRRALRLLRPGAILVVVGRGGVVDEAALCERLHAGNLHAALDVTAVEPLPADSPLWSAPNLLITPHIGGYGDGWDTLLFDLLNENLARHDAGLPPRDLADRLHGY
jgi:D-2-hydroxyacid dehydrogenase (NADP+)